MAMVYCRGCAKEIHETALTCPTCGAPQGLPVQAPVGVAQAVQKTVLPPGVKGWSWGAFILSWIWGMFNGTWVALLAVIPGVGFIVAIYLGVKGREMAWRNKAWTSVEEFNEVQRQWSVWGIGILVAGSLVSVLIVMPFGQSKSTEVTQADKPEPARAESTTKPVSAPIIAKVDTPVAPADDRAKSCRGFGLEGQELKECIEYDSRFAHFRVEDGFQRAFSRIPAADGKELETDQTLWGRGLVEKCVGKVAGRVDDASLKIFDECYIKGHNLRHAYLNKLGK